MLIVRVAPVLAVSMRGEAVMVVGEVSTPAEEASMEAVVGMEVDIVVAGMIERVPRR